MQRVVTEEVENRVTLTSAGEGVRELARGGNEEEKGALAGGPGAR